MHTTNEQQWSVSTCVNYQHFAFSARRVRFQRKMRLKKTRIKTQLKRKYTSLTVQKESRSQFISSKTESYLAFPREMSALISQYIQLLLANAWQSCGHDSTCEMANFLFTFLVFLQVHPVTYGTIKSTRHVQNRKQLLGMHEK